MLNLLPSIIELYVLKKSHIKFIIKVNTKMYNNVFLVTISLSLFLTGFKILIGGLWLD